MTYQFEIGQQVIWRGGWGSRAPLPATIVDRGEKNDQAVYDLDNGHWAYEHQLESMNSKIPVLLTKQQIDYIMSHAHSMELKALDANRPVSHQFYVELGQALFDAEAANKERGAA